MKSQPRLPEKREDIYQLLNDLAKRARLLERGRGVIDALIFLYRTYPEIPSNKVMARWTGIPVPALAALKGELIKIGILETKREFTEEGIRWVEQCLKFKWKGYPYPIEETDKVNRSLVPWTESTPPSLNSLLAQIKNSLARRPSADVTLDQAKATIRTIIKRVGMLLQFGDLEGLNVLVLGDDDALSLALCTTALPRKITVVDIDERILHFLEREHDNLTTPKSELQIVHADLREKLPEDITNDHDIFFTDPPYTVAGLTTFFARGLEGLHPNSPWARGYVCASRKPRTMQLFQNHITSLGWYVSLFIPNFNRYEGNTRLGNTSNLLRLDHADESWKNKKLEPIPFKNRFYTKEDLFT